MKRTALLLFATMLGVGVSFVGALGLVPRVRLVEVLTVFFGAFGGGASFAGAMIAIKRARQGGPSPR
jgi:hypothetical protein